MQERKEIQAYNLAEFCQQIQDAFNEGFNFDFNNNSHYPTSFGSFFSAILVKQAKTASDIATIASSSVQQVQQQAAELVQNITESSIQAVESVIEQGVEVAQDLAQTAAQKGRKKAV